MNKHVALITLVTACLAPMLTPTRALAWELFRSENDHVAEGNELLRSGDHVGALREYDLAARELPSEPGVHLDRGLALLAAGDYGRAREAFAMASDPPASAEIRAMAHYNTGLTYYREGEALSSGTPAAPAPSPGGPLGALGSILGGGGPAPAPAPATEPDHAAARNMFREAADAFRNSLRQVPGNRDAGWNLELALRRITEEEEAEREEREAEEESEEGEEGEESEESESGENGEESEEGESGENGEESGEGGEEESEESESGAGEEGEEEEGAEEEGAGENSEGEEEEAGESGEPGEDGAEDGTDDSEESGAEESGDPSGTGTEGGDPAGESEGEGSEVESGGTLDRSLPPDMARVLDALENGEDNLAAARARGRGERAPRRVERDW